MNKEHKATIWMMILFIWGIITGRCLPQWIEAAKSPYKLGADALYAFMIITGIILIYFGYKFVQKFGEKK